MLIGKVSFTRLAHTQLVLYLGTSFKYQKHKSINKNRTDDLYLYGIKVTRRELFFNDIVDQEQPIKRTKRKKVVVESSSAEKNRVERQSP